MHPTPFFHHRWHGRVPLAVLLWRDMVCIGSLVNVAASFLALAALALGAHAGLALSVHLAPIPYNIFLLLAFLRLGDRNDFTTGVAWAWFIVMLVI